MTQIQLPLLPLKFILGPVNMRGKCVLGSHGDVKKFRDQYLLQRADAPLG